jgi:hypothetical protein
METKRILEEGSLACYSCAVACDRCATECLQELDVILLVGCIKINSLCASVCRLTAEALSQEAPFAKKLCLLCIEICTACAEECERHADTMGHCRECADECRRCAAVCNDMVNKMPEVFVSS